MNAVPLFLASDILNGTEHSKKNFYRIHSRFAKDGLATKLTFKDAVLVGINNSTGVWFYSVQGLFQAVFEYHDRKTQQCCLVELLDLWLARFDDAPLVLAVSVAVRSTGTAGAESNTTELALHPDGDTTATTRHSASTDRVLNPKSDEQPPSGNCRSDLQPVIYDSVTKTLVMHPSEQHTLPCTDVLCLAGAKMLSTNDKPNMISFSLEDTLNNFVKLLKEQEVDHHPSCTDSSQLEMVCCVLEVLKEELNELCQAGFPFDLIARYREEVNKFSPPDNKNSFSISWKRDIALCVISDWLGETFNQLEPEIALKVEKFKTEHIECIDSLPQAEAMIDMLFPACMKCLLCSWIGISEHRAEPNPVVDHDYGDYGNRSKRRKRSYQTSHNLFPLIQIILEFTNNALISGVAHVVFTRLMLTT